LSCPESIVEWVTFGSRSAERHVPRFSALSQRSEAILFCT